VLERADTGPGELRGARFVGFVPVRDLGIARGFYVGTLGLPLLEESPFAVTVDAGGTVLRLTKVAELGPQPFTIAGWEVPDIRWTVAELEAAGVSFSRYDGMDQDEHGIWTTPTGDLVAWFRDPDGNTLSLTSAVPR
jgi:catechol 2,3-dioxygenase-like lactoylglutathione lyase family enzyme